MIKKKPQKEMKYRDIKRYRYILWIILGFLILSLFINIKILFFVSLFIVANCLLLSVDRYIDLPIDIELSTFSTVLCTLAFGVRVGLFMAVATKVAAIFYVGKFRFDHIFMISGYCLAAVLTKYLYFLPIVTLGFLVTLIVQSYILFISKYILRMYVMDVIMYAITNVGFNIVLFFGFSQFFIGLMV